MVDLLRMMNMIADIEKKKGKKVPLQCLSLLICENVIEDIRTRKKSFIHSFNSIYADTMPARWDKICVVCSVTEVRKNTDLSLSLRQDNNQKILFEASSTISSCSPLVVVDLVFTFRNIVFEEYGNYSIEISSEGIYIASRRFMIFSPSMIKNKDRTKNGLGN